MRPCQRTHYERKLNMYLTQIENLKRMDPVDEKTIGVLEGFVKQLYECLRQLPNPESDHNATELQDDNGR